MEPSISDFSNSSGSEAKPVSIDGNQSTPRLTIRLKVGKKTDSQCEFSAPESVASQFDQLAGVLGLYSCKLCNLKFGSKRSLGAHVKAHASNYGFTDSDKIGLKDEHERRKDGCRGERKSTTIEKTTKHTQQEPVCATCTKKFPSMKALFGHMTCHPKRDWRGIQPPEKPVLARKNERNLQVKYSSNGAQMNSVESLSYHTNSTITEESSKEHYPLSPLSNWLVTGSGARKNKIARSESKDLQRQRFEGVSKSIKQTVHHLPILSQSQGNLEELGFLEKQETDEESLESDPIKSEILHESFLVCRRGQWKKKTEVKREARATEAAANSGTPQEGENISNCHDSKKRKLFIGVSAANNSEEEEVSQEDVEVSGIGSEISMAFLKVSVNKRPKISRIPDNFSPERQGSHMCTKCNQWFNSGQALGGHMRKHFDRKKRLAKLKAHHSSKTLMGSQVELGGERKNGGAERRNEERMGAMDLNGVMPIEDEDLKFAISMLEVVPAYAGYVRSRLFMISEA
ncbi:hypothetical protein AMTRI_Chr10g229090 [Amborella trichopoda]